MSAGDGNITIVEAVKALREDEDFADVLGFWSTHKANRKDGSMEYVAGADPGDGSIMGMASSRGRNSEAASSAWNPIGSVVEEERAVGNWLTRARTCHDESATSFATTHGRVYWCRKVMSYLIDQGAPAYGGRPNPIALAASQRLRARSRELESALPGGGARRTTIWAARLPRKPRRLEVLLLRR